MGRDSAVSNTLTVAVAQPDCHAHDVARNAREHARIIGSANARLIVFPEMSLTGYELEAAPISESDSSLLPLIEACAEAESVALVGAPIDGEETRVHIAMLRVDGGGVSVAYRKWFLGDEESLRFAPGEGPGAIDVDGWRVGLGICKDTGVEAHVRAMAALDLDLYVAGLVHASDEVDELQRRGERIARACKAPVAFASFAGPTGGGYEHSAGASTIWRPDGTPIAQAGTGPGEIVRGVLERPS